MVPFALFERFDSGSPSWVAFSALKISQRNSRARDARGEPPLKSELEPLVVGRPVAVAVFKRQRF